uniref:Nucleotidyltransferase substrate binding protein, HI0074 family n=1 Tax=Candidatus Kentrum sp. FM TaxID=2126340 RepID=A0A450WTN2_9GAMM|nr:MAG: nucleotidyltransferase substrate binding protein, HI0074 family [Candidatus Kentron sp. FM]VFJ73705.1 MAG: nucleotidyltransferase substrate binding protein, HI0074 family [Candidatus Kentron sp. FM]VFK20415.1 MAG: nucleotidyltransferase substrate binding protein, HI0074 family [Candidatus Kentron sp. FM]
MKTETLLADFSQALAQLIDAIQVRPDHDVIRAGCIQYFEFTFEFAWKTIKLFAEQEGLNPGGSPRSCLKSGFAQGWIQDEAIWLEMLDARNRMSHTYNAHHAMAIYERLPAFIQPLESLLGNLEGRLP